MDCLYLNTVIQKRLLIAVHMTKEQLSGSEEQVPPGQFSVPPRLSPGWEQCPGKSTEMRCYWEHIHGTISELNSGLWRQGWLCVE